MAKKTTYYDPAGKKQTGYVIDGKTYADEAGTQRVGVGSVVLGDSGKAWQLTDNGGVRVNPGLLTKTGSSADYSAQAAQILQKINNGEKFNTSLVGDPLMQQYRDLYIGNGQRAMQDTMGQAAALTGGYGSSYAQSAGQQAYNEWLRNLNDKALDIYQLRRNEYDKDRAALYDQLSALNSAAATEYSKERDALDDERYADELAYSRGRDTISDERYADETAYSRQQDALALEASSRKDAYSRAVSMIESGYMPTDEELAAAGISKGYAQYMVALAQQQASGSSGGGSGRSRGGGSANDPGEPYMTMEQVRAYLTPSSRNYIERLEASPRKDKIAAIMSYYQTRKDITDVQKEKELKALGNYYGF